MTRSTPRLAYGLLLAICCAGLSELPAAAKGSWRAVFTESLKQWPDERLRKSEIDEFKEIVHRQLEGGSRAPNLVPRSWSPSIERLNQALRDHPEDGKLVRVSGNWWEPYLPHYYLALAAFRLGCYGEARANLECSVLKCGERSPVRAEEQKKKFDELKYRLERWLQVYESPAVEGCAAFRDSETTLCSPCRASNPNARG